MTPLNLPQKTYLGTIQGRYAIVSREFALLMTSLQINDPKAAIYSENGRPTLSVRHQTADGTIDDQILFTDFRYNRNTTIPGTLTWPCLLAYRKENTVIMAHKIKSMSLLRNPFESDQPNFTEPHLLYKRMKG